MKWKVFGTNVALGAVYALVGFATLSFRESGGPDLSSVLWIGSGIALSVALVVPYPVWPGVALGAFVATLSDGSPPLHGAATALANGGEIWLASTLLGRFGFSRRFDKVRDVLLLVGLACGLAGALSALISVGSYVATGGAPASAFGRIWLMWWLTHGMGMLLVVPPTLIVRAHRRDIARRSLSETGLILTLVALVGWFAFQAPPESLLADVFFFPFLLLLLASVRGDALVASLGGLIVTACAIAGAVAFRGPFASGTQNEALFLTWSFASVTIVATVSATAAVRERVAAQREVERGERRLRAVLEATSEGILVSDEVGRVTDVNSAFLRLAGCDEEGLRYADVDTLLDRLRPAGREDRDDPPVLDPAPDPDVRTRGELRLADGRILEAESAPLQGEDDASNGPAASIPGGRVWSMRDVTQRVASEAERRRLHEQLLHSQKFEGLGVLAGGIAHDFNNVLAGIMGYAELLMARPELDDEGRADAESIVKAASHAAGLCGQLLTYAGKTTAVLRPVDLCECARDMRQFMSLTISKSVRLDLDLSPEPVFALADEVQIRQVLLNLVTNASEAVQGGPGSGSILVRIRSRYCGRDWFAKSYRAEDLPEGSYAVIEVEDDGVGMDEETLRQIFDPFFSSKGTGRGLGLSAVLGVLRSHSGALTVETRVGLGTRFQVALPTAGTVRYQPPPPAPGRETSRERRVVLVVDDEPIVRETLRRMIQVDGHRVVEAGDGDEALELVEDARDAIDVIVMDLTMPRRDGLSTLAVLHERGHRIPVILASGYSAEAVPPDAAVAGFIQKPFRAAELRDMIASALRGTPVA